MKTRLSLILLLAFCAAARDPKKEYGAGGRGMHANHQMDYQGVIACLFELADLNHDQQLSETELRLALNRWLSTAEQVMDALTPHRIIAACDTDNSQQVSWHELSDEPRCLTLTQTEGLAKWLCSRARHGDFAFSEYIALANSIQVGLLSGNTLKSIQSDFAALQRSQTDARRAALARSINQPRLSAQVDALLNNIGTGASQVIALPIAVVLVFLSLIVAVVA